MSKPSSAARERAHAARALEHVAKYSRTIDWLGEHKPRWLASPLERELVFGTLRYYHFLRDAVQACLDQPLRGKDQDILCLMLVGAYQLGFSRVPDHAAIHTTVAACRSLRKPWATGLVNAVLRKINTTAFRERSFDLAKDGADLPAWLMAKLSADYPQAASTLAAALTRRAPMTLRINTARIKSDAYAATLDAAGIDYRATGLSEALTLAKPQPAETLPGWRAGHVAVQDGGALWAARLIMGALERGRGTPLRVLDACCAPGGKLMHLLERLAEAELDASVIGLDASEPRLTATRSIGTRLGHRLELKHGDATLDDWWDGRRFDHVLLDAPCSGSGTLRRNPDIKLLLREDDLPQHQSRQLQMLHNLWRMVDSNGSLLYCTCSIFQEENDAVISQFLAQNDASAEVPRTIPVTLPTGQPTTLGWQLLPTDPQTDGFYFALLGKGTTAQPLALNG